MYSEATADSIKLILSLFLAALVGVFWVLHRKHRFTQSPRIRTVLRLALGSLAVISVCNYYRFSAALPLTRVNGYDMLHYYIGSKYYHEMGYYGTYPALLLADSEDQGFFQKIGIRRYRDHASQVIVPVETILDRTAEIRERFSQSRWEELKHDLRHFTRITPPHEWRLLFEDRGYNATPVARWIGSLLSEQIPVEQLKLIGFLDIVLLGVAMAFVGKAYGFETTLFAIAFLFVSFSGRWPPFGESMLRMDWVSSMIISVCLLRLRKHAFAGLFWGYATTIRVFPAIFLFGLVVRILVNVVKRGPYRKHEAKFVATAVLGFAALNEVVLLEDGLAPFRDSVRKLMVHQKSLNLSSQRVGFGVALGYRGELFKEDSHSEQRWPAKKRLVNEMKPYRYAVAAAVLYILAMIAIRRDASEALILGIAAFFFLSIASYYYYIIRVILVMNHAKDLRRSSNGVGLIFLFAMEAFSQWHQLLATSRYAATAQLSILLTVYFFLVLGLNVFEVYGRKGEAVAEADVPAT